MERKNKIKLNIVACIVVMIIFTTSLVVYFTNKPKNKSAENIPYILVKGDGKDSYKYGILVSKGLTVSEIVSKLTIHTGNIQEIYIRDGTAWKKAEHNQRIYKSSTFKLEY